MKKIDKDDEDYMCYSAKANPDLTWRDVQHIMVRADYLKYEKRAHCLKDKKRYMKFVIKKNTEETFVTGEDEQARKPSSPGLEDECRWQVVRPSFYDHDIYFMTECLCVVLLTY